MTFMELQTKTLRLLLSLLFSYTLIACSHAQVGVGKAPVVIKLNGKFGISDEKGNIVVEPVNDTAYASCGNYKHLDVFAVNPFFILKRGNKLAYAYCLNQDDLGHQLPESKRHWKISEYIYETIDQYSFNTETYDDTCRGFRSEPYLVLRYKKNGKWGLMYVRSSNVMDKHFFSYPFPASLGELRMTEAKYDTIAGYHHQKKLTKRGGYENESGFYTVKSNGKFELLEVIYDPVYGNKNNMSRWSNELYKDGGFDTIPLQVEKKFYVRKNGKWGYVILHHETKTIEYVVPCMCHALFYLNEKVFYCGGEKDTLKIYNTHLKQSFIPLPEQKPVVCTFFWPPDSYSEYRLNTYIGSSPVLKATDGRFYKPEDIDDVSGIVALFEKHPPGSDKSSIEDLCYHRNRDAAKRLFVFDMSRQKTIASFVDTGSVYQVHHARDFIIKANYSQDTKKYIREFYDARTGFYKFRIETADNYFYIEKSYNEYSPVKPIMINGVEHHWYRFESEKTINQKKRRSLGTYDITSGEYRN